MEQQRQAKRFVASLVVEYWQNLDKSSLLCVFL